MYKHDINICCFWYADQCYGFWIFVLITKILFYSQMRDIQKSLKSIWNRPYIIWRLQSWWIWCFWSCQSFANQSSNELHRFIIIEFHRSNRNWSCNRREKSDLGWVFAFWINNECCRSCHRHCRLSRSSCSWHTLYKVNHLLFSMTNNWFQCFWWIYFEWWCCRCIISSFRIFYSSWSWFNHSHKHLSIISKILNRCWWWYHYWTTIWLSWILYISR